jgi:hypothetical protein
VDSNAKPLLQICQDYVCILPVEQIRDSKHLQEIDLISEYLIQAFDALVKYFPLIVTIGLIFACIDLVRTVLQSRKIRRERMVIEKELKDASVRAITTSDEVVALAQKSMEEQKAALAELSELIHELKKENRSLKDRVDQLSTGRKDEDRS